MPAAADRSSRPRRRRPAAWVLAAGPVLHVETLAEGIEERAQLRELQRRRCDSGQGLLCVWPLEPDAVDALLDLAATFEPADETGALDHEHA